MSEHRSIRNGTDHLHGEGTVLIPSGLRACGLNADVTEDTGPRTPRGGWTAPVAPVEPQPKPIRRTPTRIGLAGPVATTSFTPNGTIVMQAVPGLGACRPQTPAGGVVEAQPPPPPPPSVEPIADEPTMMKDIDAAQRRVAAASAEEVSQYVDALRRSEGIAPPVAPAPMYAPVQSQVPVYTHAPPHMHAPVPMHMHAPAPMHMHAPAPMHMHAPTHPAPQFPPVGWRPGEPITQFAPANPVVGHAPPPSIAPASVPAPKKRSAATSAFVFVAMFLATMAGVGALTYVALRSGHFDRGAVTTHSVE